MYLDIKIGPYKIAQRTEYSKIKIFDINKCEDITNDTIGKKIISDYEKQMNNPEKYFKTENNHLMKLREAVKNEDIKYLFMPENIKIIEMNSCVDNSFEYVKLPDLLIRINAFAFENCENLKELFIPDSVNYIEHAAFRYCSNLEKINLPNIDKIHSKLFSYCKKLKEITIPESIEIINGSAFKNCSSLESISLPCVKELESEVFDGCKNLKTINLSESLETLHISSFTNCGLEKITLPDKISKIPAALFKRCKDLKEINLSKNVFVIGAEAFSDCTSLEKIILPDNVKQISNSAFKNSPKIKNINVPKKLENINSAIFADSEIKSLSFNHNLKCFVPFDHSLIELSKISKLIISKNVEKIEADAFALDGDKIEEIDYQGTKEEFKEFKNNNEKLFKHFSNLKKVNFLEKKRTVKLKKEDKER